MNNLQYDAFPINIRGLPGPASVFHSDQLPKKDQITPYRCPNAIRSINYYADYAGWWRMIMPEMLLNLSNKSIINGLTTMVMYDQFYSNVKIRLQRQATSHQLHFFNLLETFCKKTRLPHDIRDRRYHSQR